MYQRVESWFTIRLSSLFGEYQLCLKREGDGFRLVHGHYFGGDRRVPDDGLVGFRLVWALLGGHFSCIKK